ncbi:MAG: dihydroorotase family protein [Oscillospiraceae bacterium]
MDFCLKNASVFTDGVFSKADILIENGTIKAIAPGLAYGEDASVFDFTGAHIFPGFADVHVHLREPGFSYKETIRTGTRAAAHGGCTVVCTMPNLNPVPDTPENLKVQTDIIAQDACVHVYPFGAITRGELGNELSDMGGLAPYVAGFSDDGRGVQRDSLMRSAMCSALELDKVITAHCEDESLLTKGWSAHDGKFARAHELVGNPSESEWRQVERDLELVRETGCKYHVCHVSTKESIALIRLAKCEGLDVTCETGPHYLMLSDGELKDEGRFRMNPPIRSESDREALIEAVCDGTVDMIATDHAPHSAAEKSSGMAQSLNGIVGLECAFPVLYTGLVKKNVISLERLLELMCTAPRRRFGLPGGELKAGMPADLTVFDLNAEYAIDSEEFLSMGRATPFEGMPVSGRCLATFCGGVPVWLYEGGGK